MSQKALASSVGISTTYMNLIETGKRPIGGALQNAIAKALEVEVSVLTHQPSPTRVEKFRLQAESYGASEIDIHNIIALYPHWLEIFENVTTNEAALKTQVQLMSERLSLDMHLSECVHNLIARITSIRSTANILNTHGDIGRQNEARFHEIIHEEAVQASEAARELITQLDQSGQRVSAELTALREFSNFMKDHNFQLHEFEDNSTPYSELELREWLRKKLGDNVAISDKVHACLQTLLRDIRGLPKVKFLEAIDRTNGNIELLARHFDVPIDRVIRRLAMVSSVLGLKKTALNIRDQLDQDWLLSPITPAGGLGLLQCVAWPIFQLWRAPAGVYIGTYAHDSNEITAVAAIGESVQSANFQAQIIRSQLSFEANPKITLSAHNPATTHWGCKICDETTCKL